MNWISQLHEMLFPFDGEKLQIENGFRLKSENLPEAIFKYRSFDENGHSIKSLEESTIWLSGPLQFNDPFDSTLTADYERLVTAKVCENLTTESIAGFNIPQEVIDEVKRTGRPIDGISDWVANTGGSDVTKENVGRHKNALHFAIQRQCDELRGNAFSILHKAVKICSFTTRHDSLLMWGHYADSHRGFCVKYGLKGYDGVNDLRLRLLFPVMYSDALTDMTDFLARSGSGNFNNLWVQKAALTKSKEWEYEQEWRLLFTGVFKDDCAYPFLPATAIYLGARIEQKNKDALVQLAKKKGVEVYQMELSKQKYQLLPTRLM